MRQFRIDEFERERILNLHENATKRQYLNEQSDCMPINQVEGISELVNGEFESLVDLFKGETTEVCKGGFGTKYTFTKEKNPNLKVASFTIDGNLKLGSQGA